MVIQIFDFTNKDSDLVVNGDHRLPPTYSVSFVPFTIGRGIKPMRQPPIKPEETFLDCIIAYQWKFVK